MREKVVGKKVDFTIEYEHNGRKYVTIYANKESLALLLVKAGLAKVLDKKHPTPAYEELVAAQEDCKTRKVGVFSEDSKHIEKHTREVTYFGESDYSPAKLLEESKKEPKPLAAILEYVFSPSYVTLYVYKLKTVVKMSMSHLFTPQSTDKNILANGKAFVEKMLLHRTVGVKLARVEDNGNISGRIHFPAGDIA